MCVYIYAWYLKIMYKGIYVHKKHIFKKLDKKQQIKQHQFSQCICITSLLFKVDLVSHG